jgi:hypothetical protein
MPVSSHFLPFLFLFYDKPTAVSVLYLCLFLNSDLVDRTLLLCQELVDSDTVPSEERFAGQICNLGKPCYSESGLTAHSAPPWRYRFTITESDSKAIAIQS